MAAFKCLDLLPRRASRSGRPIKNRAPPYPCKRAPQSPAQVSLSAAAATWTRTQSQGKHSAPRPPSLQLVKADFALENKRRISHGKEQPTPFGLSVFSLPKLLITHTCLAPPPNPPINNSLNPLPNSTLVTFPSSHSPTHFITYHQPNSRFSPPRHQPISNKHQRLLIIQNDWT